MNGVGRTSPVTNLQENDLINSGWNDCSYPELSRSLPGCEGEMWLPSKDREALPGTSIMSKTGLWILNLKGWHCLCSLTGVIFTDPANYYLCLCWSRRYVRTKSVVKEYAQYLRQFNRHSQRLSVLIFRFLSDVFCYIL